MLPLDGDRKPTLFFSTPAEDWDAFFSPNGKYIATSPGESGRDEIYVQTFPVSADKWLVSTNGGASPRWSQNGRELIYVDATVS
ncbi:MAG: PD40 domain-containing protein [Acidobacteria bacterium]|nr:PD40 domain-containing protein [Acidobacteriota bacterium]